MQTKLMSNRKKEISPVAKMGVFLLLFIILYYLFNLAAIIKYYPKGKLEINELQVNAQRNFSYLTYKEFDRRQMYDVLLLGSSHCYRDFDPRIFKAHGINAYNLGSSSQTPLNTLPILKDVIRNTHHVLLEVYPYTLSVSGSESFVNLSFNLDNYWILTKMAWSLKDPRCLKLLTIKPMFDQYYKSRPIDRTNFYRGYIETDQNPPANTVYASYDLNTQEVDTQLQYIERIIKYCQSHKVGIDLVYAPVPKELVIKKEGYVMSRIHQICRKHGIKVYDYGRNHSLPSRTCFFDDDHLNKTGVEKFNETLIKQLKKDGFK